VPGPSASVSAPSRAAARGERDRNLAGEPEHVEALPVFLVEDRLALDGFGDFGHQFGDPVVQHVSPASDGARPARGKGPEHVVERRIAMLHRNRSNRAVFAQRMDRAGVADERHHQVGQPPERFISVERCGKDADGVGQERLPGEDGFRARTRRARFGHAPPKRLAERRDDPADGHEHDDLDESIDAVCRDGPRRTDQPQVDGAGPQHGREQAGTKTAPPCDEHDARNEEQVLLEGEPGLERKRREQRHRHDGGGEHIGAPSARRDVSRSKSHNHKFGLRRYIVCP